MYSIVLSIILFSKGEWSICFSPDDIHASGYQVPPSEYTICLPFSLMRELRNDSAISIFLCLVR
jgi:hypothetical protein